MREFSDSDDENVDRVDMEDAYDDDEEKSRTDKIKVVTSTTAIGTSRSLQSLQKMPDQGQVYEDLDDVDALTSSSINYKTITSKYVDNQQDDCSSSSDYDSDADNNFRYDGETKRSKKTRNISTGSVPFKNERCIDDNADDVEEDDIDARYGYEEGEEMSSCVEPNDGELYLNYSVKDNKRYSLPLTGLVNNNVTVNVNEGDQRKNSTFTTIGNNNNENNINNNNADESPEQELVDSTVKLLRLLANLSIDESIGIYLSRRYEPFQVS